MKIFAISDLHLSKACPKPMDIFGPHWEGHWERVQALWRAKVGQEDTVLIGGDISWAMTLEDARADLEEIRELPGRKVLLRGNHDYWWGSLTRVRDTAGPGFFALQNDSIRIGRAVIAGSRGWSCASSADTAQDEKIVQREAQRLELSLTHARKLLQPGDRLMVMMHFPPFNDKQDRSPFTEVLESAGVEQVSYGHLHGPHLASVFEGELRGVYYRMVSCDYLRCDPVLLAWEDADGSMVLENRKRD